MNNERNTTIERAWDTLIELGVSEQTLQIVTDINGYSLRTLEDVLFAHTGYRSFDQVSGLRADGSADLCPI